MNANLKPETAAVAPGTNADWHARRLAATPRGVAVMEGEGLTAHNVVGDGEGLGIDNQVAEPVIFPDIAAIKTRLSLDMAVDLLGHGGGAISVDHGRFDQIAQLAKLFFVVI